MPPMEHEAHENLLNELLDSSITHERRTEVLQELRKDYGTVLSDFETLTKSNEKLTEDNDSLVRANSKLFRDIGILDNPALKEKEEELSRSETITLEDLEK